MELVEVIHHSLKIETVNTYQDTCVLVVALWFQTLQRRTTLIILCEDGSLRIYVANTNSNTEYWLQPQFQPTSPLVLLRARGGKQKVQNVRKSEQLKFPIDYFEHCQLLQPNEVEVGVVIAI